MRRLLIALPLALALLLLGAGLVRASDLWLETDAAELGRGGASPLARPDLSPGAAYRPGTALGFGMAHPYAGTGLLAGSVRLQHDAARWGGGASWSVLASPVHDEHQAALGARVLGAGLRTGAALRLRWRRFDGASRRLHAAGRLGVGGNPQPGVDVALFLEAPLGEARASPRFEAAAEVHLGRALRARVAVGREVGAAARHRLGVAWQGDAGRVSAGYDLAADAVSFGAVLVWPRKHVAWAARVHPELGWSQAWDVELSR